MDCESMSRDWPCVVVYGREQAALALAAGRPVCLLSAPGVAGTGGVLWWRALMAAAQASAPQTPMIDLLDCGAAPGLAMAALRAGQRHLVLRPEVAAWPRVVAAAAAQGACVRPDRPQALDLAERGAALRLAAHLSAVFGHAQDRDSSPALR